MLEKKREREKKRKKIELKFYLILVKYPFTAPNEDVMLSKQTKFWSLNNYNNYFIYSSL